MEGIPAYAKIYALGHPALANLTRGNVTIQEKVDGSQFSFAKLAGRLRIRSKGREIYVEAPDKMFQAGVEYVQSIQDKLVEGWVYRSEYLRVPKHNSLCYARTPRNHLALYDVMTQHETYGNQVSVETVAKLLDIDSVPYFNWSEMNLADFQRFMATESFLGGQTIEGLVLKNYGEFCQKTGHVLMGKYVSEHFKEVHNKEWKLNNPGRQDIMMMLIGKYKSEARWEKAVFHLRDEGTLQNAPQDIGPLMKMIAPDVAAECKEEICEELWKYFWPQVSRGIVQGLPDWYKKRLLHQQFGEDDV
tara:strand:+ start:11512 stop:12420 length:909 start_codon:yes stop_codon:yes gene_type:complete